MSFMLRGRTYATAEEKRTLLVGHGWDVKTLHSDAAVCTLRATNDDGVQVETTVTSEDMEERERQRFASILPRMLASRCLHKLYKAVARMDRSLGEC